MTLARRCVVRAPASTANLGPGFDVLAAALALSLELEVVHNGAFSVRTGLDVPRDRSNLVVHAFERLHPADGFEFRIASEIPLSGGLGSSAAAIVAGLLAADHMFGLDADVPALAAEIDGHPDNVAATLHGGFVVCNGGCVHGLPAPAGLEAVLVVPHEAVRTEAARAALAREVPLADAVFNVAHAATLVVGLCTSDFDLIAAGLHDRLHQPQRAHLYPRSADLVARAPALGALGATISGAGPTVLVWCEREHAGAALERLAGEAAGWAEVMRVQFQSRGAHVRAL